MHEIIIDNLILAGSLGGASLLAMLLVEGVAWVRRE